MEWLSDDECVLIISAISEPQKADIDVSMHALKFF